MSRTWRRSPVGKPSEGKRPPVKNRYEGDIPALEEELDTEQDGETDEVRREDSESE